MPEENEHQSDGLKIEGRKAFSSPQERTDFNDQDIKFNKPNQPRQNLSQCLLLGPQNLEKIFDNRKIVEHSQTLFLNTGYFSSQLNIKSDFKCKCAFPYMKVLQFGTH